MKNISLDAFLREYSVAAKQQESAIKSFIKKHITTNYIKFLDKYAWCESIIEASCFTKSGDVRVFKSNSVFRYVGFIMRMIDLYTDIKIDFEDGHFISQYDELNKVGAIDYLVGGIPESEYTEFSTILNMKLDDIRDNEYSVTALLYNFKKSLNLTDDIIKQAFESDEVKNIISELDK